MKTFDLRNFVFDNLTDSYNVIITNFLEKRITIMESEGNHFVGILECQKTIIILTFSRQRSLSVTLPQSNPMI